MDSTPPNNLEELIHRELAKLPDRPAPETLIPRVLAKIQARQQRRWWRQSWPHWPWAAQLASLPLMAASVAAALFGVSTVWRLLIGSAEVGAMTGLMNRVSAVWDFLDVLGNAVLVLGRSVGQQWLLLALLVPLTMYLACVGLGTLCYRLAVYRR
jgi:hypothetical protein